MATEKKKLQQKTLKVDIFHEFEKEGLKKEIDLIGLFNDFGVKLTKKGANYIGLCPFHEDKTPSLSVSREKGLYNCFGCGESGDAFTLVEKKKGLNFQEAKKYLIEWTKTHKPAEDLTLDLDNENHQETGSIEKEDQPPADPISLNRVIEYYHKQLFITGKAMNYLTKRGLNNPALISRFKLGYCDGTLSGKMSAGQREALKEKGIYNQQGFESFKNCIVFPIFDDQEQVVGLYGRNISPNSKIPHLYLKGEHRGLFNHKSLKVYDEIILTESLIDALSLISAGLNNVTACYGVNGFTPIHLQELKEGRVKKVCIAYDNDEAGQKAADKLKATLLQEGITAFTLAPSEGKDWNEALLKGITKNRIEQDIKTAEADQVKEEKTKSDNENDFKAVHGDGFFRFNIFNLTYTLTGVKDIFANSLKVHIKAEIEGRRFDDDVNLYSSRSRDTFSNRLAGKFDIEPRRVEKDLNQILDYLEEEQKARLTNRDEQKELTAEERERGLTFLKSEKLIDEIVDDLGALGYVGERLNKILIYLCATSRKMSDPISVLIVSQSASGKSYLVDTVKKLIPQDEVMTITTLSDQALNYLKDLSHKFLVFGEAVHNDAIEHQIREMLSSKELSRLVTVKDDDTGEMISKVIRKEVIVSSVMSTTSNQINPENASRYFIINTDESREQTRRIYESQRQKYSLDRFHQKESLSPQIISKHQAAQRLLKKRVIVNPLAHLIEFPDSSMRLRRDHDRFIDLISVVCFLRQYQKKEEEKDGVKYIECDINDYTIAYHLMVDAILKATINEIPTQAVELYESIRELVRDKAERQKLAPDELRFTQRELREGFGYAQMFVKRYLKTLVDYEFVRKYGGQRGTRVNYTLIKDEPLNQIDTTMIPPPEAIKAVL